MRQTSASVIPIAYTLSDIFLKEVEEGIQRFFEKKER